MELTMTTPAILFPAISLFFLAYTSRFQDIARLVRELHGHPQKEESEATIYQIKNLIKRLVLIRNMQIMAEVSFLLCVITIFLVYNGVKLWACWIFAASLLILIASISLSIYEIHLSIGAISIALNDIFLKKNSYMKLSQLQNENNES